MKWASPYTFLKAPKFLYSFQLAIFKRKIAGEFPELGEEKVASLKARTKRETKKIKGNNDGRKIQQRRKSKGQNNILTEH